MVGDLLDHLASVEGAMPTPLPNPFLSLVTDRNMGMVYDLFFKCSEVSLIVWSVSDIQFLPGGVLSFYICATLTAFFVHNIFH